MKDELIIFLEETVEVKEAWSDFQRRFMHTNRQQSSLKRKKIALKRRLTNVNYAIDTYDAKEMECEDFEGKKKRAPWVRFYKKPLDGLEDMIEEISEEISGVENEINQLNEELETSLQPYESLWNSFRRSITTYKNGETRFVSKWILNSRVLKNIQSIYDPIDTIQEQITMESEFSRKHYKRGSISSYKSVD